MNRKDVMLWLLVGSIVLDVLYLYLFLTEG